MSMLHALSSGAPNASAVGALKPEAGASMPKDVLETLRKAGAAGVRPNAEFEVGNAEVGVEGRVPELGRPLPNPLPGALAANAIPKVPLGPPFLLLGVKTFRLLKRGDLMST